MQAWDNYVIIYVTKIVRSLEKNLKDVYKPETSITLNIYKYNTYVSAPGWERLLNQATF
jgi:hypothetical protein